MIPVHHQLQPQILVEETRGVPMNVVQERQVPVLHQYVVEENVRPVHHQLQQQYVVEENLRNSNFVNEFNRLEGNLESEQQRLLEKDSRIGKCLRWCIFLLPLLFFLICFIFCIVILSLLGQARSLHSIEQSRDVLTALGHNLQKRPFNHIISVPFQGLSVAKKCPEAYEIVPLYQFRGVRSGCYCGGNLVNGYRCVGPNIFSDCRRIDHQTGIDADVDADSYLCGKRVSSFRRKESKSTCGAGEKPSGDFYCIPAAENELITDVYLHRLMDKTTTGQNTGIQAGNQAGNQAVNQAGNQAGVPRALAQRKTHRQAQPNPVNPNPQVYSSPAPTLAAEEANKLRDQCFKGTEWTQHFLTKQKTALCPQINTHIKNPSDRAMVGIISTIGENNSTHPCLNPNFAPKLGNSNFFTEKWLRQSATGCGTEFAFEENSHVKANYLFSGQSPAQEFWASNDLEKRIADVGVNSKVPSSAFVNFYSERHQFLGNGASGCSSLRADKFNNLERELTTWQRVVTILTSIALALSILGLLLSLCYICLKRVRLFRKPVIYAVVYVLAFIVAALLIAQAIYYFVIRDNYSIFRNYRSLGQYIERGCLSKPHGRAAVNFINYIYEVIEKIAPFIIFLFAWSIFFILVFLVCWIIGRIKRQAICNRPI